jgi:hypothetical protein
VTQPVAFSYSRLGSFETCPKRFHATAIAKSTKEPESQAMFDGKQTHKALEVRVGRGVPLPSHLGHLEPLSAALAASPGQKLCEYQMAINPDMQPTGWFDKDVYCRAVADLLIVNGTIAALFDYKTGKKSNDFLQLKLTSTMALMHLPEVNTIKAAFIWTKDRTSSPCTVKRDDIPEVWSEIAPRVNHFQKAFETHDFPARPGWACRGCPVKMCQYWEPKR